MKLWLKLDKDEKFKLKNISQKYVIQKQSWVSSVWPPGLNAFESIVIYDRNAQLFQSFLGQLKKILHQTVFFVPFE